MSGEGVFFSRKQNVICFLSEIVWKTGIFHQKAFEKDESL